MIKTFYKQLADALGPEYLVYQAVSDFGFSTWYICKKGTLWGFIPWNSCLATIGSVDGCSITICDTDGHVVSCTTPPKKVADFIGLFDEDEPVEPFSFSIRLPAKVVKKTLLKTV